MSIVIFKYWIFVILFLLNHLKWSLGITGFGVGASSTCLIIPRKYSVQKSGGDGILGKVIQAVHSFIGIRLVFETII